MPFDLAGLLAHPEENATLRAFARSWPGRLLVVAIVAAAMFYAKWPHFTWRAIFIAIATCAAYIPRYRIRIALAGSVLWIVHRVPHSALGHGFFGRHVLFALIALGMGWGVLHLARHVGRKGVFAYPVTTLIIILSVLLGLSQLSVLPFAVKWVCWELAIILSFSKWFLAYGINNVTARRPRPGTIMENLSVFHPFWGGGQVPFGKGWSYIRKHEARDDDRLARTQIKAVRLMLCVAIIKTVYLGYLSLTGFVQNPATYMMAMIHGEHPGRLLAGLSLPVSFFGLLLNGYIWGNTTIAMARLAGFDLQQNMINPLFSRSIADFWNRWYFYFKELLVEFFFLPSFRRAAWMPERLRVFTATLMAAGFGNYVFHVYQKIGLIRHVGLLAYVQSSGVYAVYCLILGTAIGISQAINPFTAADGDKRDFKPHICLGVITFFCLIGPLGAEEQAQVLAQHSQLGLLEYLRFYAYIFHLV